MKKLMTLSLIFVLLAMTAAGCGKKNVVVVPSVSGAAGATSSPAGTKNVTIKMFQFKVEIAEPLGRMIAEYEKGKPRCQDSSRNRWRRCEIMVQH